MHSGTLLNLWHHTHVDGGFEEQWLIEGTPTQLGLESSVYRLQGCNRPFEPARHNLTSEHVRLRVLDRMHRQQLRFKCIWRTPNLLAVDTATGPRMYGRQTRVQCFDDAARLRAGEYLTSIGFYNTQPRRLDVGSDIRHEVGAEAPGQQELLSDVYPGAANGVEQHLHFQGYILYDHNRSELHYHFSNKYDSYLWATYPSRPELIYCGFTSKFSEPVVCMWDLPGCSQPRYPRAAPSVAGYVSAAFGVTVYLSYAHTAAFAGANALVLIFIILMAYKRSPRNRTASHEHAQQQQPGAVPPPNRVQKQDALLL